MRATTLRIVLGGTGVLLLGLGLVRSGTDILGSFHYVGSGAAGFVIPVGWLVMALAGALLCMLAFFAGRRKA
jgi:hypothetical protein